MRWLKNIIFVFSVVIIFILTLEFIISFSDIDISLLKETLYYQGAQPELHRVSSYPNRLYELIPGSSIQDEPNVHPKETKYDVKSININSLGFRDKERSRFKEDGVFRIVILGGSNTFGATVGDEDTYPALLQKLFDERYSGKKVEVWNAGLSAYMLSQKIAYAEYIIKNFDPDILIFQHQNNSRRAFHINSSVKDLKGLFEKNKELYKENLPPVFFSACPLLVNWHYFLVLHSKMYRIFYTGVYAFIKIYKPEEMKIHYNYAQVITKRAFEAFASKHKNIKMIMFTPVQGLDETLLAYIKFNRYQNVDGFSLDIKNKPEEYSEVHPPSYVYEWYAEELYSFLIRNGYMS